MKRVLLHSCFWMAYLVQNVLLIFFVNSTHLHQAIPGGAMLALANCLVLLLPKIGLTYFILYGTLERMTTGNRPKEAIVFTLLAFLFSLLLYRMLVVCLVDPYIYHWRSGQPLFYPLGFLVALMDVGFVAGVALVIRQLRLQARAREREKSLQREKLESELRFLRSQVHPHFLFNTLNNIYALTRKKSDAAPEIVLRLSKLLRFMLYETAQPLIRIEDEIRVLDDYIELEKIRYDSRLTVSFYREIDNQDERISPLLLLPFVENAFKHGPGGSHFESFIHIDMVLQLGQLRFTVENNLENAGVQPAPDGIGLANVKRQLELLYAGYDIRINQGDSVFSVSLSINLNAHEKNKLPHTGR